MGEPTQVVSAAFGLAKSAFETAKWLQRVCKARNDAEELYGYTLHIRALSVRIGRFIEKRWSNAVDPEIAATLDSIRSSIESAHRALAVLDKIGKPLAQQTDKSWYRRVKYVWDSDVRQDLEKSIDRSVQFLILDWSMLQTQESDMARTTLRYSEVLEPYAEQSWQKADQRVNRLEIPDTVQEDDVSELPSPGDEEELDRFQLLPYLDLSEAALVVPIQLRDAQQLKRMLDDGFDASFRVEHERTLLHQACLNLDEESLEHLLSFQHRLPERFVDATDDRGDTALMLVAKQADEDASIGLAKQLLSHKCDPSIVNPGETPRDALYYVIDGSKTEKRVTLFKLLVDEYGADLSLITDAFPKRTKQYLGQTNGEGRRDSQGDTAVEDDEDPELMLERRPSLLERVKRRFSTTHPDSGND
ncbi:uncharacterized protein HMPREF1541_06650 [Cyphellophora europaea CBS 101466]|uniref:Uncharacterized protein n=1 Tax=Cyphellophora europaea (strain CBS 101466) TaxID=1220924 RepID=W2RS93_CYPE1|nr:uncharacterized protein HMPREF1541_06650 [Cyphellophora europaea CBS 101466]ETN38613.1 hypothetical protein HMPREF1541_06650 [Cyphellophora europaea CBS 101466]